MRKTSLKKRLQMFDELASPLDRDRAGDGPKPLEAGDSPHLEAPASEEDKRSEAKARTTSGQEPESVEQPCRLAHPCPGSGLGDAGSYEAPMFEWLSKQILIQF